MENLRIRRNIDIVMDSRRLKKFAAEPTFKSFKIFHKEMVAIERYKATICLNRPIYVGFSVLDLSKILMYQWHYKEMPKMFPDPEQLRLIYTDTDSLVYSVKTNDLYDVFAHTPELFDFSGYDSDHQCCNNNAYLKENKKRIGIMKDELDGIIITEFIALRSKLYSFEIANKDKAKAKSKGIGTRKCKGVKKNVVKKHISHEDYKQCLLNEKKLVVKINTLRSRNHQLETISQYKHALSYFDDKRFILEDCISTRPHGHYKNKK